jgi:hypothetical protein
VRRGVRFANCEPDHLEREHIRTTLGATLRDARLKHGDRGLSQACLGNRIGCAKSTIARLEQGLRRP